MPVNGNRSADGAIALLPAASLMGLEPPPVSFPCPPISRALVVPGPGVACPGVIALGASAQQTRQNSLELALPRSRSARSRHVWFLLLDAVECASRTLLAFEHSHPASPPSLRLSPPSMPPLPRPWRLTDVLGLDLLAELLDLVLHDVELAPQLAVDLLGVHQVARAQVALRAHCLVKVLRRGAQRGAHDAAWRGAARRGRKGAWAGSGVGGRGGQRGISRTRRGRPSQTGNAPITQHRKTSPGVAE